MAYMSTVAGVYNDDDAASVGPTVQASGSSLVLCCGLLKNFAVLVHSSSYRVLTFIFSLQIVCFTCDTYYRDCLLCPTRQTVQVSFVLPSLRYLSCTTHEKQVHYPPIFQITSAVRHITTSPPSTYAPSSLRFSR